MKKITAAIILVIFALGTILSSTAFAWEQGNTKVLTSFKAREEYDTNIFYDRYDPNFDWITILTPRISGEQGFGAAGKHKAKLDYKVDLGIFGKYKDQNYGNHDAYGQLLLDFEKVSVDVNNRFQFTSSRAGTEFESRNLRKIDTFQTILGWHFNKFDLDTGYQFYIVDYLSDTLQAFNYFENTN